MSIKNPRKEQQKEILPDINTPLPPTSATSTYLPYAGANLTTVKAQIFRALADNKNRTLSNTELGISAGIKNPAKSLYKIFRDAAFVSLLKEKFDFHANMSRPERVLFNSALQIQSKTGCTEIPAKTLIEHAGLSTSQAYPALKRQPLCQALNARNIRITRRQVFLPHEDVNYISTPGEQLTYCLSTSVIDLRNLYRRYSLHNPPSAFIVNCSVLAIPRFREIIATALLIRTQTLKATSAAKFGQGLVTFFSSIELVAPDVTCLASLKRNPHIRGIIAALSHRKGELRGALEAAQWVFRHAASVMWQDQPTEKLITSRDFPAYKRPGARPIEGVALQQLDRYVNDTVIPCLERGIDPPELSSEVWDLIIIIRHTGRRHSDLMGLIDCSEKYDQHCIQLDVDGDPRLFIDAAYSKTSTDIYVPLAHMRDYTPWGNPVARAIERQRVRVANRPPCKDGRRYLFRCATLTAQGQATMPRLASLNNSILPVVSRLASMRSINGERYIPTAHQFRHTVATEMINAGLDIHAVMSFMGHSSIATTERYIKLLQEELKRQLKAAHLLELYRPGWISQKRLVSDFEQEDGVCGHPWKIPSCPARTSKVCVRKKAFPRHLPGIEKNILIYQSYADKAEELGEIESAGNFRKVVRFNKTALAAIQSKGVFVAAIDFFGTPAENGN